MAKFDAGQAVERLDYDFTEYGGGEGRIPEPTTAAVNGFFAAVRGITHRAKHAQAMVEKAKQDTDKSDEDAVANLSALAEEASKTMADVQSEMANAIALLCGGEWVEEEDGTRKVVGGSPDLDALRTLPFRVLQKFSEWLMGEINPKKDNRATKK